MTLGAQLNAATADALFSMLAAFFPGPASSSDSGAVGTEEERRERKRLTTVLEIQESLAQVHPHSLAPRLRASPACGWGRLPKPFPMPSASRRASSHLAMLLKPWMPWMHG